MIAIRIVTAGVSNSLAMGLPAKTRNISTTSTLLHAIQPRVSPTRKSGSGKVSEGEGCRVEGGESAVGAPEVAKRSHSGKRKTSPAIASVPKTMRGAADTSKINTSKRVQSTVGERGKPTSDDDTRRGSTSPWAVGSTNLPAPLKGTITSVLFRGASGGSKSKYRAKAYQRGEMWDPRSRSLVTLPSLLDPSRPLGLSVDHMAEGYIFVKALNGAGYTLFEELPYDAQILLSRQINHPRNVLVVPKCVEEHKGPAFCKALAGRPAKVPRETKDYISGVEPYVRAHLADTDREWTKLRDLHDVKPVAFLETYLKAVRWITTQEDRVPVIQAADIISTGLL